MGGTASISGRGRRPKPTNQKLLAGNPGKRALNKSEPQFTKVTNVDPPEWLPDNARMMWQTILPELLAQNVLCITDLHNLEGFCMAYARWREAELAVDRHGILISTETSVIKNPALTAVNEAKKQMVQFGALLGLDPSSRARLTGNKQPKKQNPFSQVLNM